MDSLIELCKGCVLHLCLGIDTVQLLVLCSQFISHVLSHAHQLIQSFVSDPGERGGREEKREERRTSV